MAWHGILACSSGPWSCGHATCGWACQQAYEQAGRQAGRLAGWHGGTPLLDDGRRCKHTCGTAGRRSRSPAQTGALQKVGKGGDRALVGRALDSRSGTQRGCRPASLKAAHLFCCGTPWPHHAAPQQTGALMPAGACCSGGRRARGPADDTGGVPARLLKPAAARHTASLPCMDLRLSWPPPVCGETPNAASLCLACAGPRTACPAPA